MEVSGRSVSREGAKEGDAAFIEWMQYWSGLLAPTSGPRLHVGKMRPEVGASGPD